MPKFLIKLVITALKGAKTRKKMIQYRKSDRVMEAGDHFKNGASSKSQMSRENTMIVFRLGVVFVLMFLFFGCASHNIPVTKQDAPFYLAYDSEEVIRDQSRVATLTSTYGLEIDGIEVTNKNMRSSYTGTKRPSVTVVDVLPGEYQVRLTQTQHLGVTQKNTITHKFEAGRIYNVTIKILPVVEENKSEDVARKIAENRNKATFEQRK